MPAFRFKLEPLLRQRLHQEGEKRRALAEVVRQQLEVERRIRTLQQQIVTGKNALSGHLVGTVETAAIREHANMTMSLDMQARQLALVLADLYQRAEAARTELIEASKRRKTMERLREIRYEAWKAENLKRETAELDDLTMARVLRRNGDLS